MTDAAADTERGVDLLAGFVAAGYARVEPPVLQPASVFLDQSGEDIRGRLYLTSDAAGADLCLRPEFTIPVFLQHLASGRAGPAAYSYLGPVFRLRVDGPGESIQAGIESYGRRDREAADAEILGLTLETAATAGAALTVRIGDVGLFLRILDALGLPEVWKRRVRRGHARGQPLDSILAEADARNGFEHAGVLAALANADRPEARALVEDLLAIAGISPVGGRSASEIAERFLEQASAKETAGVSAEQRQALQRFLEIGGNADECAAALRRLARDAAIDLEAALDEFETRLNFIAARGVDLADLEFSTRFGRRIDYYTGFVFEGVDPRQPGAPVLGGGRYDRLARTLGAATEAPAVGAAIWCERLRAAAEGPAR